MLCAYDKITGKYLDNDESAIIKEQWKYLNNPDVILLDKPALQEPYLKKIVNDVLVYDNEKIAAITPPETFNAIKEAAKLSDLAGVLTFLKNVYKGA